jgi:hypothetical protein
LTVQIDSAVEIERMLGRYFERGREERTQARQSKRGLYVYMDVFVRVEAGKIYQR